ncbi:MAG: hypothetical protein DRO67_03125 [Candidatus Asgardarchaeum californiense]|nr:MAG: hypothetical protein DRO67_03125 [Candidatus Asgardarchaeum californiense]
MKRDKNSRHFKLTFFLIIIICSSLSPSFSRPTKAIEPFFTLKAITISGEKADILNLVAQQLAPIGINLKIHIIDWVVLIREILFLHRFDLCFIDIVGSGTDPDFTGVYNQNGPLNLFGYDTSMDWDDDLGTGRNEWYIKQGTLIMPREERIQHYWEWENYLMDKILPCIPFFTPRSYYASWSNLQGYNSTEGIIQSWGKMSFDGLHSGQLSDKELAIADISWADLNPLTQEGSASEFITNAILEPLVSYDANLKAWPHLASSWELLNETHLRIHLRKGIKWQLDPDGLFPNEEFDAYDVYFTYYMLTYFYSSILPEITWIDDMKIIDKYTIDFFIDGDPSTPENEPSALFLNALTERILPEHYLNQTQHFGHPDTSHPSWTTFSKHPFGTGLFEFNDFQEGYCTTLTRFNDCWLLDPSVDKTGMDFERRFGTTWALEKLKIYIIMNPYEELMKFESGHIDIADVSNYREKRVEYSNNNNFNVQSKLVQQMEFLAFNLREERTIIGNREPCDEDPSLTKGLAVRKAIAYAINKEEINRMVFFGEEEISHYPIYATMGIWLNPNIIRYSHDYSLAKEYLSKAGYGNYTTNAALPILTVICSLLGANIGIWWATTVITRRRKQT